jgi:hypothetical protein
VLYTGEVVLRGLEPGSGRPSRSTPAEGEPSCRASSSRCRARSNFVRRALLDLVVLGGDDESGKARRDEARRPLFTARRAESGQEGRAERAVRGVVVWT